MYETFKSATSNTLSAVIGDTGQAATLVVTGLVVATIGAFGLVNIFRPAMPDIAAVKF